MENGDNILLQYMIHSLIKGVLIQSCSAGAKNFTNYILSSTIQWCYPKYWKSLCHFNPYLPYVDYYQNNQFYRVKISSSKFCSNGTMIFNILDNTTELYMTKYIIGEILAQAEQLFIRTPLIKLLTTEENFFYAARYVMQN